MDEHEARRSRQQLMASIRGARRVLYRFVESDARCVP
jgi:hypothetical protein